MGMGALGGPGYTDGGGGAILETSCTPTRSSRTLPISNSFFPNFPHTLHSQPVDCRYQYLLTLGLRPRGGLSKYQWVVSGVVEVQLQ